MKKIMMIGLVLVLSILSVYAGDKNEQKTPKLGIGYQGLFMSELFNEGLTTINAASLRMKPMPIGGQLEIGQYSMDAGSELDLLILKGKGYFAVIENPNSCLYLGGSLGYYLAEVDGDIDGFSVAPLTGVEFSFSELPEIGFNFEVSYEFIFLEDDDGDDFDVSGIGVTTGVNYYF